MPNGIEKKAFAAALSSAERRLGFNIRILRERAKMTIGQLAGMLKKSVEEVAGFESHGHVSATDLETVKEALRVDKVQEAKLSDAVRGVEHVKAKQALLDYSGVKEKAFATALSSAEQRLGHEIGHFRQRAGISIPQLASTLGKTVEEVAAFESRGQVPPADLDALKKALRLNAMQELRLDAPIRRIETMKARQAKLEAGGVDRHIGNSSPSEGQVR
jgi:DNA-binding transcriptional regulator YiaG